MYFHRVYSFVILVPISMARAVDDHEAVGEHYISFKKGDSITIYSKHAGTDDSIWEGSVVRIELIL